MARPAAGAGVAQAGAIGDELDFFHWASRRLGLEECVHQIENRGGFLRLVDGRAKLRAVAHAVREVSGELFHLADVVLLAVIDQHARNSAASSRSGRCCARLVVSCRSQTYCSIWRKIHGLELAARPIITASQPVSAHHADGVLRASRYRRCRSPESSPRPSPRAMRRPIGLAAIALLARARMQRDGLQAAILGQPRHADGHQFADRSSRRGTSW